jgi:hypothetical protein
LNHFTVPWAMPNSLRDKQTHTSWAN